MAKTITYNLKIDAGNSMKSMEDLNNELTEMKNELRTLDVGSDAFKKLQRDVVAADAKMKNLNKSVEGMDFDQIAGEAGKFAGGIGAITGAFFLLGDAEDETMKELQENLNKGLGVMMAFKGGIELVTAGSKLLAAAQSALMVSTGAATTATAIQTVAQQALNAVMMMNPIMMIVAAVGALAVGFGVLYLATRKQSAEQKIANDVAAEAGKIYGEESAALQVLGIELQNSAEGTKKRADLINEMNDKYGSYLPNLLTERSTHEEIAIAIDTANKAMMEKIRLDVIRDKLTEVMAQKIEKDLELQRQLNGEQKGFVENLKGVNYWLLDLIPSIDSETLAKQMNKEETKQLSEEEKVLKDMYAETNKTLEGLTFKHKDYTKTIDKEADAIKNLMKVYEEAQKKRNDVFNEDSARLALEWEKTQAMHEKTKTAEDIRREDYEEYLDGLIYLRNEHTGTLQGLERDQWDWETKKLIEHKNGLAEIERLKALELNGEISKAKKEEQLYLLDQAQKEKEWKAQQDQLEINTATDTANAFFNIMKIAGAKNEKLMKGIALTQIAVDTAKAISSTVASSTANPLNAVTFGAAGAAQFAAMLLEITANMASAYALLKAEKGGLIGGSLHSGGGTIIEAERGEAIINRKSTRAFAPMLSAINQSGGGNAIGGGGYDMNDFARMIGEQVRSNIKTYVVSTEMSRQQRVDTKVVDRASF